MNEELVYTKTNREKKMTPKRGFFWCWKCDRQLVAVSKKCIGRGAKRIKHTLKKETNS